MQFSFNHQLIQGQHKSTYSTSISSAVWINGATFAAVVRFREDSKCSPARYFRAREPVISLELTIRKSRQVWFVAADRDVLLRFTVLSAVVGHASTRSD